MDSKDYTKKKYSLSEEGETPKKYGNFNTYSEDIIYRPASSKQSVAESVSVNNHKEEIHHEVIDNEVNRCKKCGCEILDGDKLCIGCYNIKFAKTFGLFFALWISTAIITAIFTGTAITFGIWWFWLILFPYLIKKDKYITKRRLLGSKPYSIEELTAEFYGDPEIADMCREECNIPESQKIDKFDINYFVKKKVFKKLKKCKSNIVADYDKSEENTIKPSELTESKPVSYKIPFVASTVALIAILALVIYLNTEQHNKIKLSEATYAELLEDFDTLKKNHLELKDDYSTLESKYNNIYEEYEFYKYCAVCVNENDPYYHHFTCKHFDTSRFWIYNIEAAQGKGYDPCPDCRLNEQ